MFQTWRQHNTLTCHLWIVQVNRVGAGMTGSEWRGAHVKMKLNLVLSGTECRAGYVSSMWMLTTKQPVHLLRTRDPFVDSQTSSSKAEN